MSSNRNTVLGVREGEKGTDEGEIILCSHFLLLDHCVFKTGSIESYTIRLYYLLFLLLQSSTILWVFHCNPLTVSPPSSLSLYSTLLQSQSWWFHYLCTQYFQYVQWLVSSLICCLPIVLSSLLLQLPSSFIISTFPHCQNSTLFILPYYLLCF